MPSKNTRPILRYYQQQSEQEGEEKHEKGKVKVMELEEAERD